MAGNSRHAGGIASAVQNFKRIQTEAAVRVAATGWCNKCGARPTAEIHKRPDGSDCPYLATGFTLGVSPSAIESVSQHTPMDESKP